MRARAYARQPWTVLGGSGVGVRTQGVLTFHLFGMFFFPGTGRLESMKEFDVMFMFLDWRISGIQTEMVMKAAGPSGCHGSVARPLRNEDNEAPPC